MPENPIPNPATTGTMGSSDKDAIVQVPGLAAAFNDFFTEKIVKWAFFSVLMALIPLIASWLNTGTSGKSATLTQTIGEGQLLLIASALCARSCGELFGSGKTSSRFKIAVGASTLCILLLSAMQFSNIAASIRNSAALNTDAIVNNSLTLYVCAVVSGMMCVWLSER
jgi:hypothetical protein